ncbi:demethylmenaquinone methyltransferase [Ruania alba]|uniref:Demethylmenaquinone methyltransferase n=1 Tax=Ruania alba TaxID=648782 RepID=A0A1H5BW88_9MICO|nr:demethylmenaquinone methyltransferase [Ruania alba]SED58849.1 demethylmenaquinone methyltransferase / 2-methoxy-6-polyprenyl-1,4-benzoquinol methylase [Ruania alba]
MSRASLAKDPREVAGMFDGVAPAYDLTNDVLSMGMDRLWRVQTRAAVAAAPGERVLDLAAGTGTSSEPYADAGIDVVPCDFSAGMVAVGKRRRPDLDFVVGDATALPFADATFDAVTISFGLRNVVDTTAALAEMFRVTAPGGRLVICEFSTPPNAAWRGLYGFYRDQVLPRVASLVSSNTDAYSYLSESIADWPDQRALAGLLHEAGWRSVAYRNLSGGIVALHRATKPA